jgi:hypothetical protein
MRMPSFSHGERRARARTGMGILLSLLLITTSILTIITLQHIEAKAANSQLLPGQQVWQQGVSSLLFGANDASWQWSSNHLGNTPAISDSIRNAGITVIRTPLHATDAQARVSAIESAGAKCLGILEPADAEQVVKMLGSRCNLYEWMNEPDNGGPTADVYASSWNQNIPTLRTLNPNAMFIGPAVASPNTGYIQRFLTLAKQAGNIPDVISYHMYPCTDQTIANCPAQIASYGQAASQVRATVNSVLGYDLPLAVTEWNYSWKPNQTPQNDPYIQTFTALSLDAMAQANITMANQFDIASRAGNGSLDMVNTQNGQALPQLDAMGQAVQKYAIQQKAPAPPIATSTQPGGPQPIQTQLPTQSPPLGKPTAVNQPPPIVVIGAPPTTGTFLIGQNLYCEPGAPANPQISITTSNIEGNALTELGVTQDGCSLVFKVEQPQQTLRLNWWNQGMAITNKLSFLISSDSTNGIDGTWTNFSAGSYIAAGGSQLVTLQNPGWVKISLSPPQINTSPVNLVMEFYTVNDQGNANTTNAQPISLPQH